jgi:hypothetical protein
MADSKLDLGNIERFNGENFHLWKFQMRAVFLGKELMGVRLSPQQQVQSS